jgi:hypothetical protein
MQCTKESEAYFKLVPLGVIERHLFAGYVGDMGILYFRRWWRSSKMKFCHELRSEKEILCVNHTKNIHVTQKFPFLLSTCEVLLRLFSILAQMLNVYGSKMALVRL